MAKITNPSRRPLVLPTRHIVPAEGELVTTNDVIQHTDNWTRLWAMSESGEIGLELDVAGDTTSPVYATDVVEAEPEPGAKTPVYATDPVEPAPEPVTKATIYATDDTVTVEVKVVALADAEITPKPASDAMPVLTAPADMPADAIPAKAKK